MRRSWEGRLNRLTRTSRTSGVGAKVEALDDHVSEFQLDRLDIRGVRLGRFVNLSSDAEDGNLGDRLSDRWWVLWVGRNCPCPGNDFDSVMGLEPDCSNVGG